MTCVCVSGNELLVAKAFQLLFNTFRRNCKAPELVGLCSAATTAILRLKVAGFGAAIDAFVRDSLQTSEHSIPCKGACRAQTSANLTHRVRNANLAISLMGGYAEVVRPGALAVVGAGRKQVKVLEINQKSNTAVVCSLPATETVSVATQGIDEIMPLLRTIPPASNHDTLNSWY